MTTASDEDKILRVWTRVILRTLLIAAGIVVILELGLMMNISGEYVEHVSPCAGKRAQEGLRLVRWIAHPRLRR